MSDETTPQDSAAMSPASAGSHGVFGLEAAMRRIESGDIREADAVSVVKRLRECRSKTALWCDELAKARLTDEEREAIERSIRYWRGGFRPHPYATVLSQLLRRLQQLK